MTQRLPLARPKQSPCRLTARTGESVRVTAGKLAGTEPPGIGREDVDCASGPASEQRKRCSCSFWPWCLANTDSCRVLAEDMRQWLGRGSDGLVVPIDSTRIEDPLNVLKVSDTSYACMASQLSQLGRGRVSHG